MTDSLKLTKFAGLMQAGVSLEQSLESIGGIPKSASGFSYLLEVASDAGSSVAKEMEVIAELLGNREKFAQRIVVAQASPKATARLVMWLPVIVLVMAQLIGWNVLGSLVERPIVLLSLFFGTSLLIVSKLITSRMIKGALPQESFAGFFLLGVAIECASGASIAKAKVRALVIYEKVFNKPPLELEIVELSKVEKLVEHTGAHVEHLLRSHAQQLQSAELVLSEIRIEKLGVRLMLPLGLGVLPAFVLLAIVPLMVTTLGSK